MTTATKRVFVVPFNEAVLGKTGSHPVAVRTNDPGEISRIAASVSADRLHCIEVSSDSLAGLDFKKEWLALPLVFRLKRAGRLLDSIPALETLRGAAARFYFPATPENITAARVLSSLMVKTGLLLDGEGADWDALEDLVVYDSCGKVPHSSVEPFRYVYAEYKNRQADYNELYLEKEGTFYHCDAQGNVALSGAALAGGDFIGTLDKADAIDFSACSLAAREKRRAPLLKFEGCAVCPGWLACGYRNSAKPETCGMKPFMTALLDAAEQVNKNADHNI
ncbi:MAG TPA: hypothetical protein PKI19_00255 [Elusimicrobiales bacterium]|nr:hypothetical protein [Elusimicrobiales bacterium]